MARPERVAQRDLDIPGLCDDIRKARLTLRRFREERREAVRQYVGSHWSDDGSREQVPVNLLSLYVSIVGRNLIAKNPRVMLSTFQRAQKPVVKAMESWANQEIERLRLQKTLERVVLDALFSVGICKVALADPAATAHSGFSLRPGEAFCERVDLDDWFFDVHAHDFQQVSFMGHRYRVPLDVVKDSKLYGKARKDLTPSTDSWYNREGDERISALGRGYYAGEKEEWEDYVDLIEVYLPRHKLVLTLCDEALAGGYGTDDEPLRAQRWLGPDGGPYHILAYGVVPGNAMPKAPLQDLIDLHEFANQSYRKLMRQAARMKQNTAVAAGADTDANRLMAADDGDIVRIDRPESLQTIVSGGPQQALLAMFQQSRDLFSWAAGNLEAMGGLSPQAKTLGQDELLTKSASGQISDLQDITVNYTADVVRALCWYWHHDPFKEMRTTHAPVAGLPSLVLKRRVTPEQRLQVPWEEMDIRVDPYSLAHTTPQQQLQAIVQVFTQLYLPIQQMAQQQGVGADLNALFSKVGALLNQPDLQDILSVVEPAADDAGAQPEGGGMPPTTTRNYNRRSVGGASQYGKDVGRLNAIGGQGQQQEMKPMTNGVG